MLATITPARTQRATRLDKRGASELKEIAGVESCAFNGQVRVHVHVKLSTIY
jgi:hypothetical protein